MNSQVKCSVELKVQNFFDEEFYSKASEYAIFHTDKLLLKNLI